MGHCESDLKEYNLTNAQNNTEPECSTTFDRLFESELLKSTETRFYEVSRFKLHVTAVMHFLDQDDHNVKVKEHKYEESGHSASRRNA